MAKKPSKLKFNLLIDVNCFKLSQQFLLSTMSANKDMKVEHFSMVEFFFAGVVYQVFEPLSYQLSSGSFLRAFFDL